MDALKEHHGGAHAKKFPQVEDFEKENGIIYNNAFGTGTSQVSGTIEGDTFVRSLLRFR